MLVQSALLRYSITALSQDPPVPRWITSKSPVRKAVLMDLVASCILTLSCVLAALSALSLSLHVIMPELLPAAAPMDRHRAQRRWKVLVWRQRLQCLSKMAQLWLRPLRVMVPPLWCQLPQWSTEPQHPPWLLLVDPLQECAGLAPRHRRMAVTMATAGGRRKLSDVAEMLANQSHQTELS